MKNPNRAVALCSLALAFDGCATIGPAELANGRSTYNAVINETEDQQILSMIVRQRYDETFGMLAVSSVTASLRVGASLGANVGIGPQSGYEGNLVPLSAGATYEENPVISYVPMRGEEFVQRMLSPMSAEQTLLLTRMSTDEVEVLRFLIRRANGLANPLYSPGQAAGEGEAFDRFTELYARLRDAGELDIVQSSEGEFQVLIHDFAEDSPEVAELLETIGVEGRREAGAITIPLRFFVGTARGDGLDLETPSALEIIEAAGVGVEVPEQHRLEGLARSLERTSSEFMSIHSSRTRPPDSSIAVTHRGWWFFIDPRDVRSKQAFMVLRTLIGLRLNDAASEQDRPVLTVPVGG